MKRFFFTVICLTLGGIALAQNATLPQNITLKALDGSSVQTSAIQNDGKPIIVNFWATWCKPCNRELNTIKELYEEWQEETGVKIVAISIDDARSAQRVKPHVDGNGWEYEVYIDQTHTFVINGKGEIVWQHASYVEGDEEELIEVVRKVAAEGK